MHVDSLKIKIYASGMKRIRLGITSFKPLLAGLCNYNVFCRSMRLFTCSANPPGICQSITEIPKVL